jgi:hypothetical protein
MHDSEDWRQVQTRLRELEAGQAGIQSDIRGIKQTQQSEGRERKEQHEENQREIATVKVILLGDPEDIDDNPGMVMKLDRIYTSAKTTQFWAKVIAGLLGLLLAYIGAREAMSKVGKVEIPHIFSSTPAPKVYARSQQPPQNAATPPPRAPLN